MPKAKRNKLPKKFRPGFMVDLDRRGEVYRCLKSAYDEIVQDAGGLEEVSHGKLTLIERAVFLEALCRHWEQAIVREPNSDLSSRLIQATNSLIGLYKTIGCLDRKPKSVPSLKSYIRQDDDEEDDDE